METTDRGEDDILIPMDEEILEFYTQLKSSTRTIFSASYGDGKSTFLSKFSEAYDEEFVFITIYPLNYQVAENRDIFEYIKRDILMQLFSFYEFEEVDYSWLMTLWGYFSNEKLSIIDDIIESVPNFNIAGIGTDTIKKPLQILIKNVKKLRNYKEDLKKVSEAGEVEKFLTEFDSCKGSIYEFDVISQTICHIINKIRETNPKKEVILVVEDLDRIDPAHIFRLLNIMSAHIERSRPGLVEYESVVGNNKFDFDKIMLVCDFKNIENIFHHFYGAGTDFKGYISKFSSNAPFEYSLRQKYKEYILGLFDSQLQRYSNVMGVLVDMIIEKKTKEDKYNSLRFYNENIGRYLILDGVVEFDEYRHHFRDNNLLKLLCILKVFSIDFEEFHNVVQKEFAKEFEDFIGVSWLFEVNPDLRLIPDFKLHKLHTHKKQLAGSYFVSFQILNSNKGNLFNIEFEKHITRQNLNGARIADNLPKIVQILEGYIINSTPTIMPTKSLPKVKSQVPQIRNR